MKPKHPILRLYPSAWRRRYGDELSDLLDELPATPASTLDLLRGALTLHFRALTDRLAPRLVSAGGPPMPTHPLQRHPTAAALVAGLLLAPTLTFVGISILAYDIAVPGWAAAVDPVLAALAAPLDLFLLAAPFVAFLIAALPLIGLRMERVEGELRVTLALRARALNLVILLLAVLVGGILVGHVIGEFLVEVPL